MANDTQYNGWKNYATWATALWLNNEYGYYTYLESVKAQLVADCSDKRVQTSELAMQIKSFVEELMPQLDAGIASDLLGWAAQQIDFTEIAENMLYD